MKALTTFISFLFLITLNSKIYSQAPTYNLVAKNFCLGSVSHDGDALYFDVYLEWTNSGTAPNFELAGTQLYFSFNKDVLTGTWPPGGSSANPDTSQYSYKIVGSDLPTNMQPRSNSLWTASSPTANIMRGAINTFPGAGFGVNIPAGSPVIKIVRYRLWNKTGSFNFQQLNIAWRNPPIVAFATKVFAYVGTTNTDITTSATHSIEFSNVPLPDVNSCSFIPMPIANFWSDSVVIHKGGVINFYDSSGFSPTSWNWRFPGAVPSISNLRNPTNILYDSAGSFSVTLIVSNGGGSDSITKTNYITVLPSIPSCPITWKNTIKIHDAGNVNDSLIFGASPGATNGIDTCFGEFLIPPPPPTGVFDCRFTLPNNIDDSKIDFRKDTLSNFIWLIKFQPSSSGYPITFSWNNSSLPNTGIFYLRDIITGTIVNINMKNQSSYVLTNPGINILKIDYLSKFTQPVSFNSGWNILSVPLLSENMSTSVLFPGAVSPAYYYNNGYITADTIKNSKGYWLKFSGSGFIDNTGVLYYPPVINLSAGWNLIGPFETNIPLNSIIVNPPGILASDFFGYNNGYVIADTLKSGRGYWIKASSGGTLIRDTNDAVPNSVSSDSMNNWLRFEFTDNNQNNGKLYLANQNQMSGSYELPPVPPSGIFDIRFSTDKYAESLGQDHIVKLNTASRPLRLRAYNIGNKKFRISDAIGGVILNVEIKEGVEIIINEQLDNLIIVDDNQIPDNYSLKQNYPNPFNPVTTIKYQLPQSGIVKIRLYNILGKEILNLVNEFKEAGTYEVKVNGDNLPSGTYFYRMESNNFRDLKKMILLK